MSVTFAKNSPTASPIQSSLQAGIIQTLDKSFVNQRITSFATIFNAGWQTLARPLRYGNHAAAFAELLKSHSGEGN